MAARVERGTTPTFSGTSIVYSLSQERPRKKSGQNAVTILKPLVPNPYTTPFTYGAISCWLVAPFPRSQHTPSSPPKFLHTPSSPPPSPSLTCTRVGGNHYHLELRRICRYKITSRTGFPLQKSNSHILDHALTTGHELTQNNFKIILWSKPTIIKIAESIVIHTPTKSYAQQYEIVNSS